MNVSGVLKASALSALLSLSFALAPAAQSQQTQQPPAIPDAPAPQKTMAPLTDAAGGPIKPGGGAGTETPLTGASGSNQNQIPQSSTQAPPSQPERDVQTTPPETATPE
jgi:hypothetical protein